MKVLKRAVSRIPAMPKTRSFGKPETFLRDVAHRVERVRDDDDHRIRARARRPAAVTEPTIFSFVVTRSSRLIPGERGSPAVITTTSEPAVSS